MDLKLKAGEIVTTIATIGSNVETVEYKDKIFALWAVGGQDKLRPLWHHFYQDANGLIYVVGRNDRDSVEEAQGELNKMMNEDENALCGCARFCQHTHTLHGNSLGKVNERRVQTCGTLVVYAGGTGGDGAVAGCKVHVAGFDVVGRGKADWGRGRGRGKGEKARSVVPPPAK